MNGSKEGKSQENEEEEEEEEEEMENEEEEEEEEDEEEVEEEEEEEEEKQDVVKVGATIAVLLLEEYHLLCRIKDLARPWIPILKSLHPSLKALE